MSAVTFRSIARTRRNFWALIEDETAASFLERVHADDRLRVDACVRDLRPDNPSYAISYRYLRPDGQQVWFESTGRAEFDEAGQIVRIRGLRVDITERKQIEEELASRLERQRSRRTAPNPLFSPRRAMICVSRYKP